MYTVSDTTGAPAGCAPEGRLLAMDHLRALAMLVGVVFHASLAYSPLLQPYWPSADRQSSALVDALIWLPHLMRMPLFFLVAGFFTAWLAAHRGLAGLARQRLRRILLPLLVSWPLVHFGMLAALDWAALTLAHPSPMLRWYAEWRAMPEPMRVPPSLGHLWFLYYLLLFSLLFWVGRSLELGSLLARITQRGPRVLLVLLPLLLLPGFLLTSAPHPAPESLLPQAWALLVFGPFFALGVAAHGRLDWLQPLQRLLAPGLLACALLYAIFLHLLGTTPAEALHPTSTAALAVVQATLAAWGTLLCLLAGLRWLDRPIPLLRKLTASAYWTYLIHLPLLFVLQFLLLDLGLPWPLKLAIAISAALALCIGSHTLLVQHTPLRRYVG
jgi:glucan biosynthesis protein C